MIKKDRNIFLASALATSLVITSIQVYRNGSIDKDALLEIKTKISQAFDAAIADTLKEEEKDIDTNKCDCGGKGYIIHGDGHKTQCPCLASGSSCKCSSVSSNAGTETQESQYKNIVRFYTKPNCVYCTKWEKEQLERFLSAGWTVETYSTEGLAPFFEFIKNGKKTESLGYTTLEYAESIK